MHPGGRERKPQFRKVGRAEQTGVETGRVRVSGGAAPGEIPEWKLLSGVTQSESATPALPGPETQPREGRGCSVRPTVRGEVHSHPAGARRLSELAVIHFHSCASVGTAVSPAESCWGVWLRGPPWVEKG